MGNKINSTRNLFYHDSFIAAAVDAFRIDGSICKKWELLSNFKSTKYHFIVTRLINMNCMVKEIKKLLTYIEPLNRASVLKTKKEKKKTCDFFPMLAISW